VPDMDQGIKRLIQTHPADVLALTLPGADYLGTLPVDVAAEPRLALDTLLRVRYKGIECAVDLEAEARARLDMGRRLFEYGVWRAGDHRHRAAGSLGRALARDGWRPAALAVRVRRRRLDAAVLRVLAGKLHVSYELIRESSVYRDLLAEDIARSKAETAREAALLALRGRFGTLPEDIERAVASAPVEALFDVLAHVTADSLEQVCARLAG
jgi:hypothetical protein